MRPRSSEAGRRRRGAVTLAATAAGVGLAALVAWAWPAAPVPQAAPVGDSSGAALNPWLAVARGQELPRTRGGDGEDAASIDPFANGVPAAGAKPQAAGPPRLRLSVPARLAVGDMDDIVISLDAPSPTTRLSFKLAMDADVLQAQSGAQGDWTADPRAAFHLDIAPGEGRVAVDATAGRANGGGVAGSVARVRVQAMAAGATAVHVTDIVAEDAHGRALALAPIDATADVSADAALPAATSDAARDRVARPVTAMSASD